MSINPVYPLCPSCFEATGEVYYFFFLAYQAMMEERARSVKIHVSKIEFSRHGTPHVGELLNALNLRLHCCRTHTMGCKGAAV